MAIRRLPPLRAIEAFVRIVRLGSARAAADELGLSPSALSRRVAALEDFIGKLALTSVVLFMLFMAFVSYEILSSSLVISYEVVY